MADALFDLFGFDETLFNEPESFSMTLDTILSEESVLPIKTGILLRPIFIPSAETVNGIFRIRPFFRSIASDGKSITLHGSSKNLSLYRESRK